LIHAPAIRSLLTIGLLFVAAGGSLRAQAQVLRGVVVDQTGVGLPGVVLQVLEGTRVVASTTTGVEGNFEFPPEAAGSTVVASLSGFQTASVSRGESARIVLALAYSMATTAVVAPELAAASPTSSLLGNDLPADTVSRLPSSKLQARESLPLLPAVVRGPDGLMQLGGARPHETPLLLDGFNVTDPATGISSINLPFEAVGGVEVLRDPMAVTYGGLIGGLVQLDSRQGGDEFKAGVQGFIPRPRLSNPGFGRLEGIFPRVHVSGPAMDGRLHYVGAVEYDFERIAVPGVTQDGGPNLVPQSATIFGRLDARVNERNSVTLETLAFPNSVDSLGLSPRRTLYATTDLRERDVFAAGIVRHVLDGPGVLTLRFGVLTHSTELVPNGAGASWISPLGWSRNWFAHFNRHSARYSAAGSWARTLNGPGGSHDLTLSGGVNVRSLTSTSAEGPVRVENTGGALVRTVDFDDMARVSVADTLADVAVRDVWRPHERFQVDAGVRVDGARQYGALTPSVRSGARYTLKTKTLTVIKAGVGTFVGNVPLAAAAFARHPRRVDRLMSDLGGEMVEVVYQPIAAALSFPRARVATIELERQIRAGLDAQIGFTTRQSSRLATLDVPAQSGLVPIAVRSNGTASYHELQLSVRQTWTDGQQIFASFVRSSAEGELNDFATLTQTFDVPLLQPGGRARLAADAPNRMLVWGTFNFPRKVVLSPVVEWRSGFPYSMLTERQRYFGTPNSQRFPAFMAADAVVYKTFTVRNRSADLGLQMFNITSHFNPRDVYAVVGSPQFGAFTNSVGRIFRGYMLVKW
jgi:hypothetical protein